MHKMKPTVKHHFFFRTLTPAKAWHEYIASPALGFYPITGAHTHLFAQKKEEEKKASYVV